MNASDFVLTKTKALALELGASEFFADQAGRDALRDWRSNAIGKGGVAALMEKHAKRAVKLTKAQFKAEAA